MYYLGLTHLITKKYAILQPNYCVSICMPILCPEIEGVICIIMAGPFDCRKCTICDPTIAYQLPVYWRDVVSTSEVRSWFKLGWGHEYAIFFLSVTSVTGQYTELVTELVTRSLYFLRLLSYFFSFLITVTSITRKRVLNSKEKIKIFLCYPYGLYGI